MPKLESEYEITFICILWRKCSQIPYWNSFSHAHMVLLSRWGLYHECCNSRTVLYWKALPPPPNFMFTHNTSMTSINSVFTDVIKLIWVHNELGWILNPKGLVFINEKGNLNTEIQRGTDYIKSQVEIDVIHW
jgi:bacteriorhodopsin